jgi:cation:H+ antiporter
MSIGFLFLAASAALLIAGAELFAENAAGAGRRLGVSFLAVGLILAGAEPEEFVTAVIAAARHHPAIGAGDAIGANVTMLTLVIGAACLIRPMSFGPRLRGYAAAAALTGGAAALALAGGLSRPEGIGLIGLYLVVLAGRHGSGPAAPAGLPRSAR